MPASKATKAMAAGTQVPKAPTARETARKAAKAAPAARAQRAAPQGADAYAASTWGTEATFELTTPSGQKCLARELSIEALMEMGLLDTINSLGGIVDLEVLPSAKGQPPAVDMAKIMGNAEALLRVMALVNKIVVAGVVAPEVHAIIDEEGEPVVREKGRTYVDSIPVGDRMFLFNELTGGLESLAAFRS